MTHRPGAMAPGFFVLPRGSDRECRVPPPHSTPCDERNRARATETRDRLPTWQRPHEAAFFPMRSSASMPVTCRGIRYRPADGRDLGNDGCTGRVIGARGRQDRRVGRRLPCPTNVRKALSSTLSIVTTGRSQRQGSAVPPILTRPSLRFDHDKIGTPPAPLARPLRGPVTLTPPDRQPASVSTNRRRFTCTSKPHAPRHGSLNLQTSERRSQHTGCPSGHPSPQ